MLEILPLSFFEKGSINNQIIMIQLKQFLLIQECPSSWKSLDLYLFRDENTVFYVGQSHLDVQNDEIEFRK